MTSLRNKKGFTLTEMLTVVTLSTLVLGGAFSMMGIALRCCEKANTKAYTDTDAIIAMQTIIQDVREARRISINNSGAKMSIFFPQTTSAGYYDKHTTDNNSQVDYYLSNSTGTVGASGTFLWRKEANGNGRIIKRDVSSILFETDTVPADDARSVKITIVASNNTSQGVQNTELTQRVVYLRNY